MSKLRFMEKLLDGVEVEWKALSLAPALSLLLAPTRLRGSVYGASAMHSHAGAWERGVHIEGRLA